MANRYIETIVDRFWFEKKQFLLSCVRIYWIVGRALFTLTALLTLEGVSIVEGKRCELSHPVNSHTILLSTPGELLCVFWFFTVWFQDTFGILILEHENIEPVMAMFSIYVLALTSGLEIWTSTLDRTSSIGFRSLYHHGSQFGIQILDQY